MRCSIVLFAAIAAAEQCIDQDAHYRAMATLERRADTEQSTPNPCEAKIDPRWLAAVKSFIRTRQVAVFGVERSPGLQKVHDRLRDLGACWDFWDLWQPEVIGYLRCMHSEQTGSYVFLNGVLAGNGVKFAGDDVTDDQLKAALRGAHAQFECGSPQKCEHLAPAAEIERAEALRRTKPVILFGWEGCPCTRMGQARLHEAGACFHIELWRTPNAPLLRYYQCIYGMDDHSFVWIGNKHIGTGFDLHPSRMPQATLSTQLREAGALTDCVTPHRYHQQVVAAKQHCPAGFTGVFPDCERTAVTAAPSEAKSSDAVQGDVVLSLPAQPADSTQATLEKEEQKKNHGPCWLTIGGLAACFVGMITLIVRRFCCKKKVVVVKDVKGVEIVDNDTEQLAEKSVETVERRGPPSDGPSTPGASNEDKSSPSSQGSVGSSKTPYSASIPSEPALLAD